MNAYYKCLSWTKWEDAYMIIMCQTFPSWSIASIFHLLAAVINRLVDVFMCNGMILTFIGEALEILSDVINYH